MQPELTITVDPEQLDEGTPEERACFASVGIHYDGASLTEGYDGFVNKVRPAPLLSAYHLAEWMAWNWWRLRWEPRSDAPDWPFAHCLAAIGEGYVWPNITIFSDGERLALVARATPQRRATRFRYLGNTAAIIRATEFEYVTDSLIEQVRGLLRERKIGETNLDRIWEDLRQERRDPELAKRRKMEALMGFDPEQADDAEIEQVLRDGEDLGDASMAEVAATRVRGGTLPTAESLRAMAARCGFDGSSGDVVRPPSGASLPQPGDVAAWRLGAQAAKALRHQEGLGSGPLDNALLARLSGVRPLVLTSKVAGGDISFALDNGSTRQRVVLRSKWETGRRFELARLLADRVVAPQAGRLFPATRAYTYRQKMQRSFAVELLCPFESVEDALDGDYSMESQQDAAAHFQVSELMIHTLLVNHGRLGQDDPDEEPDGPYAHDA